MELASSSTSFEIPAVFAYKKVREFQNWLMIKLVPSFKLRKSYLYHNHAILIRTCQLTSKVVKAWTLQDEIIILDAKQQKYPVLKKLKITLRKHQHEFISPVRISLVTFFAIPESCSLRQLKRFLFVDPLPRVRRIEIFM